MIRTRQEDIMNTKLLLQILLLLGCLALLIGVFEVAMGRALLFTTQGWWRTAIACWMLIVAVRMVYPADSRK
jgi:magnesium-transporting ATPase (P-type)